MTQPSRIMANICSENLEESKHFYTTLFSLKVQYDSDWFVHLISEDGQLDLGIIERENDVVPIDARKAPQGFYITFVVDSADRVYQIAQEGGFKITSSPGDTFYGQRRLLVEDPDGTLVDVSSPIPNFQF